MILLITIGFKYGIYGLVWSNVIGSIIALIINTYYSGRFLNYSTINQLLDLFPTILVVLTTISILYFYGIFTNISNPYINITSKLALGFVILISVSNYFKLMPFIQLKNLVKQHFKND
jgi:hypothetical protein